MTALRSRYLLQLLGNFITTFVCSYRPVGTPIYSMTELLHHSRAAATLRELRAGSRYEASLVLVPPPRAATELVDPAVLEFTTAPYVGQCHSTPFYSTIQSHEPPS